MPGERAARAGEKSVFVLKCFYEASQCDFVRVLWRLSQGSYRILSDLIEGCGGQRLLGSRCEGGQASPKTQETPKIATSTVVGSSISPAQNLEHDLHGCTAFWANNWLSSLQDLTLQKSLSPYYLPIYCHCTISKLWFSICLNSSW